MNLKKFAVRGIIVLAIFVALCMFFSGTIRTITTPKVKLTVGKRGKLEERINLSCKPAFPEVDEVKLELPEDTSISILRVNTRAGYTVEEGETLIEARITNYEQSLKQYQETYDTSSETLMTLEKKNKGIHITKRDQAYADAYSALRAARKDSVARTLEMDAQLSKENLTRSDVEEGCPEGCSDVLIAAVEAWRESSKALEEAQRAMEEASRYTVDDSVWSYITESRDCQEKIQEAEENLRKLMTLNEQVKQIQAPHSGYIAEVSVKEGDNYDGDLPLCTITSEGCLPVLRASVSDQ